MADEESRVDLGFVEETDCWRLLSQFFPSKVGGKPAWLSFKPLPKPEVVRCSKCGKPCIFLMQTYAPDDSITPTCFHRTLFLLVCKDPACCISNSYDNFVILRSQLPRINDFYSSNPPNEETFDDKCDFPRAEKYSDVCAVCGCAGPKRCARCQKAAYCSKEHQIVDWKAGHKKHCKLESNETTDHSTYLLPEFELVTEQEVIAKAEEPCKSEDDKMKEYKSLAVSYETVAPKETAAMEVDLEKMARTESEDDKIFRRFKKRIAHEPQQVLRYDRNGTPLWVSSQGVPSDKDIPACSCGSPRSFEFQIMPQLLNHLKLDKVGASIDWGTLAIYTCSANCDIGNKYHKEFLWKQEFANTDVV